MLFPKTKMQVITTYEGQPSNEGWLVLDLARVDTDGVSKMYINLDEVKDLQTHRGEQADLMKKMKGLLSADEDSDTPQR